MGESSVLSGSGCLSANGEGSWSSMCTAESDGEVGIAMVSGNVGRGIVGCGDGGGVLRFKWLLRASSITSTAVSSTAVIVGDRVGVVMVVVGEDGILLVRRYCPSFIHLWALLRPSGVGDKSRR